MAGTRGFELPTTGPEPCDRLGAGISKATIDREVEVLRAAFRLAHRRETIPKVPYFPFFNVDNVKMTFFEPGETDKIIGKLPDVPSEIVRFVSLTGWRIAEVLSLRWECVDMTVREVRLGTTKNGEPRIERRALGPDGQAMESQRVRDKKSSGIAAYVFHRRGGRPISYSAYRKEFVDACDEVGIVGKTTHDFRRTVARDLRRAGVSETVCMTITGHESHPSQRCVKVRARTPS